MSAMDIMLLSLWVVCGVLCAATGWTLDTVDTLKKEVAEIRRLTEQVEKDSQ